MINIRGRISYRRPVDFRTTLETEARMPALKLYELDDVEGQSNSPFACSRIPRSRHASRLKLGSKCFGQLTQDVFSQVDFTLAFISRHDSMRGWSIAGLRALA
jgi:hypothetical protein